MALLRRGALARLPPQPNVSVSFDPQNDLERSFARAATDSAARPIFYEDLMASDVFVCVPLGAQLTDSEREVELRVGEATRLLSVTWDGQPHTAVFSSLERLQMALPGDSAYNRLNARDLLQLTRGAPFVLNPGSGYEKAFSRPEISAMLDPSVRKNVDQRVVSDPAPVMLSQPSEYPRQLTDALAALFPTMRAVRRAWLAQYHHPGLDEKPHTLIAIEHSGRPESIISRSALVAQDIPIPDPPLDFVCLPVTDKENRGDGVENYFRGQAPFYERKKLFGIFG